MSGFDVWRAGDVAHLGGRIWAGEADPINAESPPTPKGGGLTGEGWGHFQQDME